MKQRVALAFFLLFAACAVAEEKKGAFDASKLEGNWKITSGEKSGEKVEAKALEGVVNIDKDTITIKADMTHVMKFKLDATATPVAITMVGEEGPAKGFTAEGIIELKGDELKLCYGMPMSKRPTAFGTKKDEPALYFVLKRQK